MSSRKNVLILCTHNSARSQIAEALVRRYAPTQFEVHSAGLDPGTVHPLVAPVMAEVGIDISQQRSKSIHEYLGRLTAHYLIVVCENAERNCPKIFPGRGERLFWPFDDPASVEGTDDERLAAFRRVRDQIDARIREWLQSLESST
jgi:arsenate reductase